MNQRKIIRLPENPRSTMPLPPNVATLSSTTLAAKVRTTLSKLFHKLFRKVRAMLRTRVVGGGGYITLEDGDGVIYELKLPGGEGGHNV